MIDSPLTVSGRGPAGPGAAQPPISPEVRAAAKEFEAAFLAEMLKHTGIAKPPETFGGGAGESQFAPLLVREYASALAERGGLGIADQIAASLAQRSD